jgi:hypothetical protein
MESLRTVRRNCKIVSFSMPSTAQNETNTMAGEKSRLDLKANAETELEKFDEVLDKLNKDWSKRENDLKIKLENANNDRKL